jgi:hypothetical protein
MRAGLRLGCWMDQIAPCLARDARQQSLVVLSRARVKMML